MSTATKIGVEVEGRWRGMETYFAAGLSEAGIPEGITHVYIGGHGRPVGFDSPTDLVASSQASRATQVVATIISSTKCCVTLEIMASHLAHLPSWLLEHPRVRVIGTIRGQRLPNMTNVEIKFDGDHDAYVYGRPQRIDTLYTKDRSAST